jgi:rare lipoprotein A
MLDPVRTTLSILCLSVVGYVVFQKITAKSPVASWYGEDYRGRTTASGVPFNPDEFTAASLAHPLGTHLWVTHKGYAVVVKVTDRGPYVPGRHLDLSKAAFSALADPDVGLISVGIEIIEERHRLQ